MLNIWLGSIIENQTVTGGTFLAATACSLLLGLFIAWMYSRRNPCTNSLFITLTLLPVIVQTVIMMVNGNIGAGVATAGAFSLVRFRSVPGKGQEITSIFLAMAVGLAAGMGYLGIAALLTLAVMTVHSLLNCLRAGEAAGSVRELKITIPEDLDYEDIFDDLFARYTASAVLQEVRTASMGSLYRLTYRVTLLPGGGTKAFLDALRERNGNLEISCGRPAVGSEEL